MMYIDKVKKAKKVKYIGCTEDQVNFGVGCDDPRSKLKLGKVYEIKEVEIYDWHIHVFLKGIEGAFNSACFEFIGESND